ncbi:MAG: redoxin domain-containing protein [Deltaproteobacteria bacterium]|nr:redoxin domain-containing protein [Deltaproteobacteria bacterium]
MAQSKAWKTFLASLAASFLFFATLGTCTPAMAGAKQAGKKKITEKKTTGHVGNTSKSDLCFDNLMELDKNQSKSPLEKLQYWTKFLENAKKHIKFAKKRIVQLRKKAAKAIASKAKSIASDASKPLEDRLKSLVELGNSMSKTEARKYVLPLYRKLKAKLKKENLKKIIPVVRKAKKLLKDKSRPLEEVIKAWQDIVKKGEGTKYARQAKMVLKKLMTKRLMATLKAAKKADRKTQSKKKKNETNKLVAAIAAWQAVQSAATGYPLQKKAKPILKKAATRIGKLEKLLFDTVDKLDNRSDIAASEKISAWRTALPLFEKGSDRYRYASKRISVLTGENKAASREKAPATQSKAKKGQEQTSGEKPKTRKELKPGLNIGSSAPRFTLRTINPKACKAPLVNLDSYLSSKGKKAKVKAVILSFFANYCQPCKKELPFLMKLHDELGPKGLVIFSISIDKKKEDRKAVEALISKNGVTYPVLRDQLNIVARRYKVERLPAVYFLDQSGKVVAAKVGYDEEGPSFIRTQALKMLGISESSQSSVAKEAAPKTVKTGEKASAGKQQKKETISQGKKKKPADDEEEDEDEEDEDDDE